MAGNKRSLDEMYGAPTPTDLFNVDSTQTVTYAILPITFNPDEPPVKRSKYEEKKNKYSALKEKYINLKASKAHADRRVEDYIKRLAEFEKHANWNEELRRNIGHLVSAVKHLEEERDCLLRDNEECEKGNSYVMGVNNKLHYRIRRLKESKDGYKKRCEDLLYHGDFVSDQVVDLAAELTKEQAKTKKQSELLSAAHDLL